MNTKNTISENVAVVRSGVTTTTGVLFLLGAITGSLVLAGTKLGLYSHAPGCGVDSGCNAIANGPWGSIPGLGWPVSFVGVAWFGALLGVWLCRASLLHRFSLVVRLGVAGSCGFFVVMFFIGHFCVWCAVAHVCNICFWVVVEFSSRKCLPSCNTDGSKACPVRPFVLYFVLITAVLGITQFWSGSFQQKTDELAGKVNVGEILAGNTNGSTLRLLESRRQFGPQGAPVEIVIFTDYQCPDCKRYEKELAKIVESRDDVSLSVKHFPMCADCNTFMNGRTLHGNACWAARAVEAAAILGGQGGWERMHTWMFEQGGSFTDQTFEADLLGLGFDPAIFVPLMMSDETLVLVQDDVKDAVELGISFTPMVFINGVEYLWYYKGQQEPIPSLVEKAAGAVKNGGGVTAPLNAAGKLYGDWRRGKVYSPPGGEGLAWRGAGPVEIIVWGDYQEPYTKELNSEIAVLLERYGDKVSFAFRYFPIDESCNTGVSGYTIKNEGSCYLSKLVEAVFVIGGVDARWEMHDWIMSQGGPINPGVATAYAAGIVEEDTKTVRAVTNSAEVGNRMRLDILSKNQVRKRGVPTLTIGGKLVPKWRDDSVDAQTLLQGIVDEAGLEPTSK